MNRTTTLAGVTGKFFTQRLMNQRQVSLTRSVPIAILSACSLQFAQCRLHKPPSRLAFAEVDAH